MLLGFRPLFSKNEKKKGLAKFPPTIMIFPNQFIFTSSFLLFRGIFTINQPAEGHDSDEWRDAYCCPGTAEAVAVRRGRPSNWPWRWRPGI